MDDSEKIMTLVALAGNAHSDFLQAMQALSVGDIEQYSLNLKNGEMKLSEAQALNRRLVKDRVLDQATILMVHAQDYIMNALTLKELTKVLHNVILKEKI